MKRLTQLLLAVSMVFGGSALAVDWNIDNSHAAANFAVSHLGISNTHGRFNKIKGTIGTDGDALKVNVEIDAASVDSNEAKRDEHLRGPDFFDVKQFPTLTFVSTGSTKTGDKTWDVTGDLTIRGVKKSITVKVVKVGEGKDPWGGTRVGFDTTFTIKRADFGMTYGPGAVGEDVTITLAPEAIQAK